MKENEKVSGKMDGTPDIYVDYDSVQTSVLFGDGRIILNSYSAELYYKGKFLKVYSYENNFVSINLARETILNDLIKLKENGFVVDNSIFDNVNEMTEQIIRETKETVQDQQNFLKMKKILEIK